MISPARSAVLQRPPLLRQVAGPVGGDPVGQVGGAGLGQAAPGGQRDRLGAAPGPDERQRGHAVDDQVGQQPGGLGGGGCAAPARPPRRARWSAAAPTARRSAGPRGAPSAVTATASRPVSSRAQSAGLADRGRGEDEDRVACAPGWVVRGPGAAGAARARRASRTRRGRCGTRPRSRTAAAGRSRSSGRAAAAASGAACPGWSAGSWRATGPRPARPTGVSPSTTAARTPRRPSERDQPELVGGQRPGRRDVQRGAAVQHAGQRGQQVAERLAGRGAGGDDHVAARPAARSAAAAWCAHGPGHSRPPRTRLVSSGGTQPGQSTRPARAGRDVFQVGEPARPRARRSGCRGARPGGDRGAHAPASSGDRRHQGSQCVITRQGASNCDLV